MWILGAGYFRRSDLLPGLGSVYGDPRCKKRGGSYLGPPGSTIQILHAHDSLKLGSSCCSAFTRFSSRLLQLYASNGSPGAVRGPWFRV